MKENKTLRYSSYDIEQLQKSYETLKKLKYLGQKYLQEKNYEQYKKIQKEIDLLEQNINIKKKLIESYLQNERKKKNRNN